MKKVIIGIHGLGNKPDHHTESRWWKEAMREGLERIGKTPWIPKFELVYWADLLYEKPLDLLVKDTEDALYVKEPYLPGSKEASLKENNAFRRRVLEFIEYQLDKLILNKDYSINYSSIADRIVRRYFLDLEAYYADRFSDSRGSHLRVRASIRSRLATVIKKYQGYEILLIGHSMGSIIAYDVLTFILPLETIDRFITIGSPLGFPVVQGKIAAEWKETGLGIRKMKVPPGITKKWHNFADLHDRVALVWQLSKNYSANAYGVAPEDTEVINDYTNGNEENPHKSYGYLRTEELARALSEFIGEAPTLMRVVASIRLWLS